MKKVCCFLLFLTGVASGYAQSLADIDKTTGTDVMKAKTMIDQYISKDSSQAAAFYYKGKIYNTVSRRDSLHVICADCKMDAFTALQKYQAMDVKNSLMAPSQNLLLFDIYNSYFRLAAKAYKRKNPGTALGYFQKAATVEDYIKSKGFSYNGFQFPAFDTLLTIDLAICARATNNDDSEALIYYKALTDANLTDSQYQGDYEYVVSYYKKKDDWNSFETALAKGRKVYPNDAYWDIAELEEIEASATKEEALNKFAEATANSSHYTLNYYYALGLYNYVYQAEGTPTNIGFYKYKFPAQINKTLAIDSTPEANLLMAQYLYNQSTEYADGIKKIKGWETADFQKRKLLKDSATVATGQAIPYDDNAIKQYAAMQSLTDDDKTNYTAAKALYLQLHSTKHEEIKPAETPVTTTSNTAAAMPVTDEAPDANLLLADSLYKRSKDYADSVKKAKGWETADFQKRKRLKDSSDAALDQAIPYAEAAENINAGTGNSNYTQALALLKNIYAAKHNSVKAAEYAAKIKTINPPATADKPDVAAIAAPATEQIAEPAPAPVVTIVPGAELSTATILYNQSKGYVAAVKKVKGWETADFQQRKRLKDSSDADLDQAIPYAEAAAKKYEGTDSDRYTRSIILLKNIYTAKHNAAKVAEYDAMLTGNSTPVTTAPVVATIAPAPEKTIAPTPTIEIVSGDELSTATALYKRSKDYADSVKKAKGWETADFQKRKRLKDSSDAALDRSIPYAEAAAKKFQGSDSDKYTQSIILLKNIYTAKHYTAKAAEYDAMLKGNSAPVVTSTATAAPEQAAVTTTPAPAIVVVPGDELSTATAFYNRSKDYADSVKKAKGWETADFQKRKRLKDSSNAALDQAIPYAEAAAKKYKGTDNANYTQSISLLKNIYIAKHDAVKAAEYNAILNPNNATVTAPVATTSTPAVSQATALTVESTPEANLSAATLLYKRSQDYADSVKKAKGWETADFQKRKRLKDVSTTSLDQSIADAEAAEKTYEAMPTLKGSDKANYIETLILLKNIYMSKHDDTTVAAYEAKLKATQ